VALILTLREGEAFYADTRRVTLAKIVDREHVRVSVGDRAYDVGTDCSTEVLPGVYVSVGSRGQAHMVRLAIEAPRSIRLLRETVGEEAGTC